MKTIKAIRAEFLIIFLSIFITPALGQGYFTGGYQGGSYGMGGIENTSGMENLAAGLRDHFIAYPNPFSNQTTVSYQLARPSRVELSVCDLTGKKVRTLVQPVELPPGKHTVAWNGRDEDGSQLAKGVYFYRLIAGDAVITTKIILLK